MGTETLHHNNCGQNKGNQHQCSRREYFTKQRHAMLRLYPDIETKRLIQEGSSQMLARPDQWLTPLGFVRSFRALPSTLNMTTFWLAKQYVSRLLLQKIVLGRPPHKIRSILWLRKQRSGLFVHTPRLKRKNCALTQKRRRLWLGFQN